MPLPFTVVPRANDGEPKRPPAAVVVIVVLISAVMLFTPLIVGKSGCLRFLSHRTRPAPQPEPTLCLTPEALALMPVTRYQESGGLRYNMQKKSISANASIQELHGLQSCSICTEDFQGGAEIRSLPCGHRFHPSCIDPWLLQRSLTCPLWCVLNSIDKATSAHGSQSYQRRRQSHQCIQTQDARSAAPRTSSDAPIASLASRTKS